MRAAMFHKIGQPLSIEHVPDPTPAPDQVIIEVANAGICGSDLHLTQSDFAPSGLIPGHEFSGTIAALGHGVDGAWKVGDRVTALPLNACNNCEACDSGLSALCGTNQFTGCYLTAQGAYAQYVAARGSMLQRLPDGVSFAEGAMVEPLAVGHHVVDMAQLHQGASVLIIGGGPIGVAVALFARLAGAQHVVVSEVSADRRTKASEVGATAVIDPRADDVLTAWQRLTGSHRPQFVFECAGVPGMLQQAVDMVGLRGRVVVAGVVMGEDKILPVTALGKEVSIHFSQCYGERDFEIVIDAMAKNIINPRPIHTSTVTLDELPAMFETLRKPSNQCKVLIQP